MTFSVYQELKIALEARCRSSHSGTSVKKTECEEVSKRQLGWLINQACPSDVEMISFMRDLLSRTSSSIWSFPIRSISFKRDRGTSIAKGTSCLMYSATLRGSLSI